MSFLKLTARERAIFIVFFLVAFVYAGHSLVYKPAMFEGEQLKRSIRQAKKKVRDQSALIADSGRIPGDFMQSLDAMRQRASNEEVLSAMVSEIEAAARQLNIRVTEIKPQGNLQEGIWNNFSISLTVDGQLSDQMAFVHHLQAPGFDLDIIQYALEKSMAEPGILLAKIVARRVMIRQTDGGWGKADPVGQR